MKYINTDGVKMLTFFLTKGWGIVIAWGEVQDKDE